MRMVTPHRGSKNLKLLPLSFPLEIRFIIIEAELETKKLVPQSNHLSTPRIFLSVFMTPIKRILRLTHLRNRLEKPMKGVTQK